MRVQVKKNNYEGDHREKIKTRTSFAVFKGRLHKNVESHCLSRQKQTDLVFSYMGPLAVLAHLALWHRNTLTERMNTRRRATATEVISMSWPLLVPYQGASTVERNSKQQDIRGYVHHVVSGKLFVKKRSIGLKLSNLYCTICRACCSMPSPRP